MNSIERKLIYTLKQYCRKGFGRTYYYVDAYVNSRLRQSIKIDKELSESEMERFLNVFIKRLNHGDSVDFLDSTERRMNQYFSRNKMNLLELEKLIASKMGQDKFDLHYEKKCYYLMWTPKGYNREVQETFHISDTYPPLMCLKMAQQLGESEGESYRILLSDHSTEVDAELLSFAVSEG